jgi:hypothetical protein
MEYRKTKIQEKIEENSEKIKLGSNPIDFKNYVDEINFMKGDNTANFVRILMKNPIDFFFGIYKVKLFGRLGKIMLRFNFGLEKLDDICLISRNNSIMGLNCYEAISFADGREVFYWKDSEIKSFNSKKCLSIHKTNLFSLEECGRITENSKWTYNEIDKIITKNEDKEKCLIFEENLEILNRKEVDVWASSTMNDDQHNILNIFNQGSNEKISWASSPGDKNVEIVIKFSNRPLNSITIFWAKAVKKFNIYILIDEIWRKYVEINNNFNLINNYKFHGSNIEGIKLLLLDSDYFFNDLLYFSILKLEIESNYRRLKLENCLTVQKRNSTWEITQIEETDFSRSQELELERKKISSLGKEIIEKRNELGKLRPQFYLFFSKAADYKNEIAKIHKNIAEHYNNLKAFSDANLKKEVFYFKFYFFLFKFFRILLIKI